MIYQGHPPGPALCRKLGVTVNRSGAPALSVGSRMREAVTKEECGTDRQTGEEHPGEAHAFRLGAE